MDQLGRVLKQTQHTLHLVMTNHLRQYSITVPQYAALTVIRDLSPLTGAQLAREVFVTPQTMHTLLKSLEQRQLIERIPKSNDSKSLDVRLTAQGSETITAATRTIDSLTSRAEAEFSTTGKALFITNLQTYKRNLNDLYKASVPR